jgi:putative redox protein
MGCAGIMETHGANEPIPCAPRDLARGSRTVPKEDRLRTVHVAWDPAGERFTASGSRKGQVIAINAPHESPDDAATGFSATELLLAGAGACAAWDVVEILRKQRHDVASLEVRVEGHQEPDPPHAYHRIGVHFRVRGPGLSKAGVERAVRISIDRYCSVIQTIRPHAEIEDSVEVLEVPAKAS